MLSVNTLLDLQQASITYEESHSSEEHDEHHGVDAAGNEYHILPAAEGEILGAKGGGGKPSGDSGGGDTAAAAPVFHSNPGASATIYLDFDGHITSGSAWNTTFTAGADIVTAAYDTDGTVTSFSTAEVADIEYIWQRVSEDFSPFDVNVTTEDPGADALAFTGGSDSQWGVRVVIGGNGSWVGGGGGIAYVGSFAWDSDTPVFVFEDNLGNGNEKYTAEAATHEAGHALGLGHDGTSTLEYYEGHGSGETGWAPIMGASYYQNVTQWSRGEYSDASNAEDDLSIITGQNGFGYRADDHGGDASGATSITVSSNSISGSGIVETTADVDVFSLSLEAGSVSLDVQPFARGPNLDVHAELYDSAGVLVAAANPADALSAQLSGTVATGQYFLHVSGGGAAGYTDYASLGQYTFSGTVTPDGGGEEPTTGDPPSITITAMDASKAEGSSGSTAFTFMLTRVGDLSGSSTVDFSVGGVGRKTAASGDDFVGGAFPSGTVTFDAGIEVLVLTIDVNGDTTSENDDQFRVTLDAATGGTILTGSADGLIMDDDSGTSDGGGGGGGGKPKRAAEVDSEGTSSVFPAASIVASDEGNYDSRVNWAATTQQLGQPVSLEVVSTTPSSDTDSISEFDDDDVLEQEDEVKASLDHILNFLNLG